MKIDTVKKLCCSFDKAELELTIIAKDLEHNIVEGILCCQLCRRVYPIVSGIPIMSPDEYREQKLEQPIWERWGKGSIVHDFRLPGSELNELTHED